MNQVLNYSGICHRPSCTGKLTENLKIKNIP